MHRKIRKLTYLQMLGYDMSWAAFYVVEVSAPRGIVTYAGCVLLRLVIRRLRLRLTMVRVCSIAVVCAWESVHGEYIGLGFVFSSSIARCSQAAAALGRVALNRWM